MLVMFTTRSRERWNRGYRNRRFSHERVTLRADRVRDDELGTRPVCQRPIAGSASFKRLVQVAAAITAHPQHSLPKACDDWSDLKAAYRFLSNPRVRPHDIQAPHRRQTRARCADHPITLVAQDTTLLDFTSRKKVKGLGPIGNGGGQGLLQHTALAVTPEHEAVGVLHQTWLTCPQPPEGETRKERLARPKKTDVWSDTVHAVGAAPPGTRFVHVADREADGFQMMQACEDHGVGFLIRAQHDRCVEQDTDKLWSWMDAQPVRDRRVIEVPASHQRPARKAKLELRFGHVTLDPPKQDRRFKEPLRVTAVYVKEPKLPEGAEPIEWMLLTREPTDTVEQAWERVQWYRCRWLIEEFHKAEKSGCRLEASQLDHAEDIQRLAAIVAVTAVRLLMLRQLADRSRQSPEEESSDPKAADGDSTAQQATVLQRAVPWLWIVVVAGADKKKPVDPRTLTPREFWLRIARRGGYIGRRGDGRPGWSTIWKGWYDFMLMFQGAELMAAMGPPRCG